MDNPYQSPKDESKGGLPIWRIGLAILFFLGAIAFGIATVGGVLDIIGSIRRGAPASQIFDPVLFAFTVVTLMLLWMTYRITRRPKS